MASKAACFDSLIIVFEGDVGVLMQLAPHVCFESRPGVDCSASACTDVSSLRDARCALTPARVPPPTLSYSLVEELQVVCGRDADAPAGTDARFSVFFDSGSEVAMIEESRVPEHCQVFKQCERITVGGVAHGSALSTRACKLRLRLRSSADPVGVVLAIVPDGTLPDGVDTLLGLREQRLLDAQCQPAHNKVVLGSMGIELHTRKLSELLDTFEEEQLRFLSICSGGCFEYHTLRDLGHEFALFHAIEWDETARDVARAHSDGFVLFLEPHDLYKMDVHLPRVYTDINATPECAPWTRLLDGTPAGPQGFKDPRAALFMICCAIIRDQQQRNPHLNYLFENVVISRRLPDDAARQNAALGGSFEETDAADLGSGSHRPRRIASNMGSAADLQRKVPTAAELVYGDPSHAPVKHPMYCIVSKIDTRNKQEYVDNSTGQHRACTAEHREVYMGHKRGISSQGRRLDDTVYPISEGYRRELMGKGLNMAHVRSYYELRPCGLPHCSVVSSSLTAATDAPPTALQMETLMAPLTHDEKVAWFSAHTLRGFKLFELVLHLRKGTGVVQIMRDYGPQ